mmetsp:Transcript_20044/g.27176  ORF Transcript_20044/g.27176 Transcript_20044/m.27176 type:complete len:277 (-) Transcript_20044:147-977(-)|eukprot:CAMPEP_0185771318 /NCGR_PEP_ID=MMETSP1174-20130828/64211_1 /TAXON_ID=35687 /ORGANISM="Dictyocha speculum, Strain CCMP1381" /LENGTH=276 /DNA_ID=CAMNT_0028457157 /DNA_START=126 /DNA_END=956 /DNA_ORIENTATION=-
MGNANRKQPRFVANPDAIRLAAWQREAEDAPSGQQPESPRTALAPGFVFVAEWGWATREENGAAHYKALVDSTARAGQGGSLYCYPAFATHVTIATLSSFLKPDAPRNFLSPEADQAYTSAWSEAIDERLRQQPEDAQPFDLVASSIELSPGAAFLHFTDESGTIQRFRDMVVDVRDSDPRLKALEESWETQPFARSKDAAAQLRDSVHVPNIIHASYARFLSPVDDEEGLEQAFAAVSEAFTPFTIRVRTLFLVNELSPYMHQSREEGILARFDL